MTRFAVIRNDVIQEAPEATAKVKVSHFLADVSNPNTEECMHVSARVMQMEVTVTFDTDGGEMQDTPVVRIVGEPLGELPVPWRGADLFLGWVDARGYAITQDTILTKSTLVLTASWQEPVVISFVAEGGSMEPLEAQLFAYRGFPLSQSGEGFPTATADDVKSFVGWYYSPDFAEGSRVTLETEYTGEWDVLYAKFAARSCIVDANWGETGDSTFPIPQTPFWLDEGNNPDPSRYSGVYTSTNAYIEGTLSGMKITIVGYETFRLLIKSAAELNYDFMVASKVDTPIPLTWAEEDIWDPDTGESIGTQWVPWFDGFNPENRAQVQMTTCDTGAEGSAEYGYTEVLYENLGGAEHEIYVIFVKDIVMSEDPDTGYVLIDNNV